MLGRESDKTPQSPKGSVRLPPSTYVWNCPHYALRAFSYLWHMEFGKHKNVTLCTKSIDISSKLMSMNARAGVPTHSQQGMMHIASTLNTRSPCLNKRMIHWTTKKAWSFWLGFCTLRSHKGTLSCHSCPAPCPRWCTAMAHYILSWGHHTCAKSMAFLPSTVPSCHFSPLHTWRCHPSLGEGRVAGWWKLMTVTIASVSSSHSTCPYGQGLFPVPPHPPSASPGPSSS